MTVAWELQQLADWYGVEASYRDNRGNSIEASAEALLAVLRVLGAPKRCL